MQRIFNGFLLKASRSIQLTILINLLLLCFGAKLHALETLPPEQPDHNTHNTHNTQNTQNAKNQKVQETQNQNAQSRPTDPVASKDFTYQGNPISVFCIDRLLSNALETENSTANTNIENPTNQKPARVDLAECSKPSKDYEIEKPNEEMIKKGYTGSEFRYTGDMPSQGYAYYKNLGMSRGAYVIDYQFSGGGSGMFTNLVLIKRDGDNLILDGIIAMGDRCNGGIIKSELKGDKLQFSLNMTPFDYVDLAEENTKKLRPYEDLAACAACCLGSVNMEYDFDKARFVSVDFGESLKTQELPTQGTYQTCFNKKLAELQKQGKRVLSPEELKDFIKVFNNECVKSK